MNQATSFPESKAKNTGQSVTQPTKPKMANQPTISPTFRANLAKAKPASTLSSRSRSQGLEVGMNQATSFPESKAKNTSQSVAQPIKSKSIS